MSFNTLIKPTVPPTPINTKGKRTLNYSVISTSLTPSS